MRQVLYPWLAAPGMQMTLPDWLAFVHGAVTVGLYSVAIGAVVFAALHYRSSRRRRTAAVPWWAAAVPVIRVLIVPMLAGWIAAGCCEWYWQTLYGPSSQPAESTMLHIAICIATWTVFFGTVLVISAEGLSRFFESFRQPIGDLPAAGKIDCIISALTISTGHPRLDDQATSIVGEREPVTGEPERIDTRSSVPIHPDCPESTTP